jgi:hypothetical protein
MADKLRLGKRLWQAKNLDNSNIMNEQSLQLRARNSTTPNIMPDSLRRTSNLLFNQLNLGHSKRCASEFPIRDR